MLRQSSPLSILWRKLYSHAVGPTGDLNHVPLLDSADIADLRRRALDAVSVQPRQRSVLHIQHGEHLSPRRGYGLDYEESRVYQPGDDVRFMNWRLAARTGEMHIKVFREERQPSAWILLDWRGSMRFGTQVRLKTTQALRTAVLLAFYSYYTGRSVTVLVIDTAAHWLKTGNDESAVVSMVNNMNQPCPPLPPEIKLPSLTNVLRAMQCALVPGTSVCLISDFIDADNDCRSALAKLANDHDVRAIHILDPAEERLPKAGVLRLIATKADSVRQVDLSNHNIATLYQDAAARHLAEREALLRGVGIQYKRLLTTVDDIETQLNFA